MSIENECPGKKGHHHVWKGTGPAARDEKDPLMRIRTKRCAACGKSKVTRRRVGSHKGGARHAA